MTWKTVTVAASMVRVKRAGKLKKTEYLDSGKFPVIDQGATDIAGFTNNSSLVHNGPLPIVIFGDHTRRVKLAKKPFVCGADGTQLLYPDDTIFDPKFYYYAIKNVDLSNYHYARHFKFLKEQEFAYPIDLNAQKRIAGVLSAYDDLIENNRRRIALLEDAARLLYREWFVNFRFPNYQNAKFENGLPLGWEWRTVASLLTKLTAKPKIKKDAYLEVGTFPCVDQGQSFIGGFTNEKQAIYSDILPLIVFGDHTRALKFIDFPFARGADGTQVLYSNNRRLSQECFYLALREIDLSNYFYARHFKFLKEQQLVVPSQELGERFTRLVKPNFEQVSKLRNQNQVLTKARDLLLPRLMNGRIIV